MERMIELNTQWTGTSNQVKCTYSSLVTAFHKRRYHARGMFGLEGGVNYSILPGWSFPDKHGIPLELPTYE